jgi:hypothetical protein
VTIASCGTTVTARTRSPATIADRVEFNQRLAGEMERVGVLELLVAVAGRLIEVAKCADVDVSDGPHSAPSRKSWSRLMSLRSRSSSWSIRDTASTHNVEVTGSCEIGELVSREMMSVLGPPR